jgi:hypothetical protein
MRLRAHVRRPMMTRTIAALLALLVCGGAVDWGHVGDDDAACSVVVVPHDHTAHRFSASPTGAPQVPDHCYICHSLRLLHVALAARQQRAAIDLQRIQLFDAFDAVACQRFGVSLSSRAPPASLL